MPLALVNLLASPMPKTYSSIETTEKEKVLTQQKKLQKIMKEQTEDNQL